MSKAHSQANLDAWNTKITTALETIRTRFDDCKVDLKIGSTYHVDMVSAGLTLEKMEVPVNPYTVNELKRVGEAKGFACRWSWKTETEHVLAIDRELERHPIVKGSQGMPISEEPWERVQTPAVYAIVCRPTGRMYIGQSKTPWLRRSVHLYWLKNFWRSDAPNVFFGNLKVRDDVMEFGPECFELVILRSMPDATTGELIAAETEERQSYPSDQLYNPIVEDELQYPKYCNVSLEMRALAEEFRDAKKQLVALAKKMREDRALRVPLPEYSMKRKASVRVYRQDREVRRKLEAQTDCLLLRMRLLHQGLKTYYQKFDTPAY